MGRYRRVGLLSPFISRIPRRQIFRIPHLQAFFPEIETFTCLSAFHPDVTGLDALAGWGHKPTADRIRSLATCCGLPYLALEDGFIRSLDLGVRGAAPLSLVLDDMGIYYDATSPSRLEAMIAQGVSVAEREQARMGMALLRERRISKYNMGRMRTRAQLGIPSGPVVLLADQCKDDTSIPLGLADAQSFRRMLEDAQVRHPGHRLIVKIHPDVASGKRRGYLSAMELPRDAIVIAEDINPYTLLEEVDAVHVVTSLLGMEALIAGRPVICHGMPFFAGWGATTDTLTLPRRAARRTAEDIFACAYLRYARYIDPHQGQAATWEETVERLAWLRERSYRKPTLIHGVGFSRWKEPHVRPYLVAADGSVVFHRKAKFAVAAAAKDSAPLAVWAGRETPELAASCAAHNLKLIRVEDGFIRSLGLGSDLIPAASLVLDDYGVYFDATRPCALERLLNTGDFPPDLLERAAHLRRRLQTLKLGKYNTGAWVDDPGFPMDRKKILVVGQVEDDASIRCGAASIRTNHALIEAARQRCPDAYIIYKPHPDVLSGNRRAGRADKGLSLADHTVTGMNLHTLLPHVDELHTITSLAGFEALLAGVKVVTYGYPFYAGWGLTEDVAPVLSRRMRRATLDELVAASLILYPDYYDWNASLACRPEEAVEVLARLRDRSALSMEPPRWLRKYRHTKRWLINCLPLRKKR